MKIRVEEVKNRTVRLSEEQPATAFPLLVEMQEHDGVEIVDPVAVSITAQYEFDHIRVAGNVATRIHTTCSRCLADIDKVIQSSFTIFYRKAEARKGEPEEAGDEVELSENDLVAATYQGEDIDLTEMVAEQVIMEVPIKPLCRDDCRGLCSSCGADLNQSGCDCSREAINPKFAALKDFKPVK